MRWFSETKFHIIRDQKFSKINQELREFELKANRELYIQALSNVLSMFL